MIAFSSMNKVCKMPAPAQQQQHQNSISSSSTAPAQHHKPHQAI